MRRVLLTILALLLFAPCACAASATIVTGKVTMAGSEPFTYVSLLSEEGVEYRLTGELTAVLERDYQGRSVRLEGRVVRKAAGPGYPAEFAVQGILPPEEKKGTGPPP